MAYYQEGKLQATCVLKWKLHFRNLKIVKNKKVIVMKLFNFLRKFSF